LTIDAVTEPFEDPICYDADELEALTAKQIGVQICHRLDLFFPKREARLDAQGFRDKIISETRSFIASIADKVPGVAAAMENELAKYEVVSE